MKVDLASTDPSWGVACKLYVPGAARKRLMVQESSLGPSTAHQSAGGPHSPTSDLAHAKGQTGHVLRGRRKTLHRRDRLKVNRAGRAADSPPHERRRRAEEARGRAGQAAGEGG